MQTARRTRGGRTALRVAVTGRDGRPGWRQPDGSLSGAKGGAEGGSQREAPPSGAECDLRAARRESRWGRAMGLAARSEALGRRPGYAKGVAVGQLREGAWSHLSARGECGPN
jgi:hypothetical protein